MRALAFLLALLAVAPTWARELIQVGGYEFAPYVEFRHSKPAGVTIELIRHLNRIQDRFEFRFELTAPRRRYDELTSGRFDVMLFESPEWGWSPYSGKFSATREILRDTEVFVALAGPGRDQSFFAAPSERSIAGVYGYHYAFAGLTTDPVVLEQKHRMSLVYSNRASIDLMLNGRVDMAILTRSYLHRFLTENPSLRSKLLIAQHPDQVYSLRALVREGATITTRDIEQYLATLRRQGVIDNLWRSAGIVD